MKTPKIVQTPDCCSGQPRIDNTRLTVVAMVRHYRMISNLPKFKSLPKPDRHAAVVADMKYSFPSMPDGGVDACLAYAKAKRAK